MSKSLVKFSVQDGVAELMLDRPAKRNALTRELISQLTASIAAVAAQPSIRVLVISGAGPAFCAGMDLDEMQQRSEREDARKQWLRDASDYRDLLVAIFQLNVPTIALVHGPAVAGGFGIALACDFVLASSHAKFALPEPKRGITAAVVSPLLVHRIGAGAALPILLSSNVLTAEEAYRVGVCHSVVSPEQLPESREALLTSILSGAPGALALTKELVRSFHEAALLEQLEAGMKVSAEARDTSEAREGLAAFLEKCVPSWVRPL